MKTLLIILSLWLFTFTAQGAGDKCSKAFLREILKTSQEKWKKVLSKFKEGSSREGLTEQEKIQNLREVNEALRMINPNYSEIEFQKALSKVKEDSSRVREGLQETENLQKILQKSEAELDEFVVSLIKSGKVNKGVARYIIEADYYENSQKFNFGPSFNKPELYPLAVSFKDSNINNDTKEVIKRGMEIWNTKYQNVYNSLSNKENIPPGPLFVESSDYSKSFVIQVRSRDSMYIGNYGTYSLYTPPFIYKQKPFGLDMKGDAIGVLSLNSDFVASSINSKEGLNLILHELGHALGFPFDHRIPPGVSNLMVGTDKGLPLENRELLDSDIRFLIDFFKKTHNGDR